MDFKCEKCDALFQEHIFILMRHPSNAKCKVCGGKGKLTEEGKKARKSMFQAMNSYRRVG